MAGSEPVAPKANPPLTGSELFGGVLVTLGVIACDTLLKALALVGGCGPPTFFNFELWPNLWTTPDCPGSPMAGSAIVLVVGSRAGTLFGLPDLDGVTGQLWGLALVAMATVTTIILLRWRWRTGADALALGALWGGILVHAGPRLLGTGATITALQVFGVGLALGDLVAMWSILWIAWRVIAELRA